MPRRSARLSQTKANEAEYNAEMAEFYANKALYAANLSDYYGQQDEAEDEHMGDMDANYSYYGNQNMYYGNAGLTAAPPITDVMKQKHYDDCIAKAGDHKFRKQQCTLAPNYYYGNAMCPEGQTWGSDGCKTREDVNKGQFANYGYYGNVPDYSYYGNVPDYSYYGNSDRPCPYASKDNCKKHGYTSGGY